MVIETAQRSSTGNLFHSLGAADRNALEPIVEPRGNPRFNQETRIHGT